MINLIIANKSIVATSSSETPASQTVTSNATYTTFTVASAGAAVLVSASKITASYINSLTATGNDLQVLKSVPDITFTNSNLDASRCSFEFACTTDTATTAPTLSTQWKLYNQLKIRNSGNYKLWARIKYTGTDSTTIEAIQNQNINIF